MADPRSLGIIVRTALSALSDGRLRKGIGWTIAAILSPFILIIVVILSLLSGTTSHNNMALDLSFNGGSIPDIIPEEYRGHIKDMRRSFATLDGKIEDINSQIEDGDSLDSIRVKAIFYSLYFGENQPSNIDKAKFVECFVTYREQVRTVIDEEGNEHEETYIVAIPIENISEIYKNIDDIMGRIVTYEDMANTTEIYYRILFGRPAPTYGEKFDDFINGLPLPEGEFVDADGFYSPVGANWRNVVTSEFGYRKDPFTGQTKGHNGIDLGLPRGTPIRSVLDGTVYLTRYSSTGYGYHIMIDHGGGFITLYAHCSKILVTGGQKVKAGDIIGEVGSTGRSTGNHLHFEVRINGEKQNPRNYLP